MDDVLTVQGDDSCIDASLASTSISSNTTNNDPSYDDESDDQYSDSDIGLNQSASREEASRRRHANSRDRNTNSRRNGSYLNGRKGESRERESEKNSRLSKTSKQRRRRLPKHYNNVPEAAADSSRTTTRAKQGSESFSRPKGRVKKQSTSTTRQKQTPPSPSSMLSTEVAQFQKMVADLESLSRSSASSPEAMWKSRIVLRSAQDADRDLKVALENEEHEAANERGATSVAAAARAASRKKLLRDYNRASQQFRVIVEETERRQRAEISCLTASEAAAAGANPEKGTAVAAQKRAVMGAAEAEEDFFDRAMRERQAEVEKISDGMKKVQEIYTDLAGLVDGQQDQIDRLEDINEEIKTDTRAGLEEIQHGIWKLCAAEQHQNGENMADAPKNSFDAATNRNKKKKVIDPSEIFNCMMACHGDPGSHGGGGVLSLADDLYHEKTMAQQAKERGADYYRDDVQAPKPAWNLPNLDDVQESAQDAYERGHAIVGGLVNQVQEVVSSGDPLREVGERLQCNPQPEEFSVSENSDDVASNALEFEETFTTKRSSDENYYREEGYDKERHRHRGEGRRSHSRPRNRSRSRSKPRQKNYEEDEYRHYEEEKSKKERLRRKGRRHRNRHYSSSR
jgi:t-SNARE complex subunit (syntaxin)/uncharacterized Zn-binding protein involved in type VI secretion